MQRHFDDELTELKLVILRMSSLVEDAIFAAVEALKTMDDQRARRVIADDRLVDEMELQIEDRCIALIALHQPMAVDLRFILMAMKINTDLERMADLAVDIAQRVLDVAGKPLLKPLVDIPRMMVLAQRMTHDVIDAFVLGDVELAKHVIEQDAEADRLRNNVQDELINDYMAMDPDTATRAVPLLLVARHLERICDHATNIAEDVIYMRSAKVVKHHPETLNTNF